MRRVKRIALSILLLLSMLALPRPDPAGSQQSPIPTPVTHNIEATAPASPIVTTTPAGDAAPAHISPLIWIAAGLLLGGAIVLIAQRTASHDP
jgi:hypothetical protein